MCQTSLAGLFARNGRSHACALEQLWHEGELMGSLSVQGIKTKEGWLVIMEDNPCPLPCHLYDLSTDGHLRGGGVRAGGGGGAVQFCE